MHIMTLAKNPGDATLTDQCVRIIVPNFEKKGCILKVCSRTQMYAFFFVFLFLFLFCFVLVWFGFVLFLFLFFCFCFCFFKGSF